MTFIFIVTFSYHFASPSFAQYFTIHKFHSDITIEEDSSIMIKETIGVEFHQWRHGIYREIPFRYRDDFGKTIETPLRVLSVTDGEGRPWKYQTRKTGPLIHIRIGDPKKFIKGFQTYIISYQVENAILFFEDHDELYWNVTGNDWRAPIKEASATVYLMAKDRGHKLLALGYEGRYGSREECDYQIYDNMGKFITKRSLHAGEGLTIAFGWDKGLVFPPSSWKKFWWKMNLRENWVFLFPLLSFLYMANLWYRKGRDPRVRESVVVTYEPPKFNQEPLIPAEVGTLIDEKLDPRDISSTIIGLAIKGYIKIEEIKEEGLLFDKTDYYLKKIKDKDPSLNPFETVLMKALFPDPLLGTLLSDLKNKFYIHLDLLKKTLYGELIRKKYFVTRPDKVRNSYVIAGILVWVVATLSFIFLLPHSIGKDVVAGLFTGIPVIGFAKFMPAKTRAGASVFMEILGFQEFMNRAEKERIERMGDTNLFSKFLPYAIALDVVDNWAKAFEGIYQDPPDWYVSSTNFRIFNPSLFTHSIHSVASNLGSTLFSAPRGSGGNGGSGGGFGGGGFSGGGFGGGGGGSW